MIRNHSPTEDARKRTPGYFSYWAFALSLVAGIALGLAETRIQGPLKRGNAEPWQLDAEARNHYMVAIALEYEVGDDLAKALNKLIAMRPVQDPLGALAQAACDLGSRGYLRSESGIRALRSAVALYSAQGRAGCAEQLLPLAATEIAPDLVEERNSSADFATPQPTKPPLPEGQSLAVRRRVIPTLPAQRSFEARTVRSFCDTASPALIEVYVVDYLGRGIPGQRIRAHWGDQESIFVSGLKVDRGDSYADFQMEEDIDYAIDMPGAADTLDASLRTGACYSGNQRTLKSYRVTFVET